MKKILITLLLFVIVITAGLFYLASNAGKLMGRYKPQLEAQASKAIGSPVKFGDIEISIFSQFPKITGSVSSFSLGDTSSELSEKAFSLKEIVFAMKPLPLMKGQIEISEIGIEKPDMQISKTASGIKISGLESKKAQTKVVPDGDDGDDGIVELDPKTEKRSDFIKTVSLENLWLKDGKLRYSDAKSGLNLDVSSIDLESAISMLDNVADISGTKLSANISNNLFNGLVKEVNLKLGLNGSKYDLNSKTFKSNSLDLDIADPSLKLGNVNADFQKTNFDLNSMVFKLGSVDLDVGESSLVGNVDAKLKGTDFDLNSMIFKSESVDLDIANSSIKLGNVDANLKKTNYSTSLDGSLDVPSLLEFGSRFVPSLGAVKAQGLVTPSLKCSVDSTFFPLCSGSAALSGMSYALPSFNLSQIAGDLKLGVDGKKQLVSSNDQVNFLVNSTKADATFKSHLTKKAIDFQDLVVNIIGGQVKLKSSLDYASTAKAFSADIALSQFQLDRAIVFLKPESNLKITGNLEDFSAKVKGSLASMPQSLSGTSSIKLVDGEIGGVNYAADLLNSVKDIPLVSGSLMDKIPESVRKHLEIDKTIIKSLMADFNIGENGVRSSNIELKSSIFDLTASGTAGFDLGLNLAAVITFSEEFSTSAVGSVKELKFLLNTENRLAIPLKIKGTATSPVMYPDTSKLLKSRAATAIKEEGSKLLKKETDKLKEKADELIKEKASKLFGGTGSEDLSEDLSENLQEQGSKLLKGLFGS